MLRVPAKSIIGKREVERLGRLDFYISLGIAISTFFLLSIWSYPGVYPGAYEAVCISSGVRPACTILPGVWRALIDLICAVSGIETGTFLMKLFGRLLLSFDAMLVYGFLRELLAFIMKARPQRSLRRSLVMQLSAALGTVLFVCVEPVWNAGQFFTANTVLLTLTVGALMFFFTFLRTGLLRYAYFCTLLLGVLTAETPMGVALSLAFIVLNYCVLRYMPEFESPFYKPGIISVGRWYMTFIYIFSMLFTIALNCACFIWQGGPGAQGLSVGGIPLVYFSEWLGLARTAAQAGGWVLWLGACLMPFIVTLIKFPEAADEERFLSYSTGLVFLFCGLVALSQGCGLPAFWFWSYFPVKSSYFLSFGALILSITLAISLTILGVDAMCRNHKALAAHLYGYDDDKDAGEAISRVLADRLRSVGIVLVPLVCLIILIPGRHNGGTREMLEVIDAAIDETLREAHDCKFMFSDGVLDPMLELRSKVNGGELKCISLLLNGRKSIGLRLRAAQDDEDRFAFEYDPGMGLRTWIRDKPERLQNCAAQVGFDLWRRDGRPMPIVGGMVARIGGWEGQELADGIARTKELAARILKLYRTGKVSECTDESINYVFRCIQWRIARMCLYRSDSEDISGQIDASVENTKLAKALNDCNSIYRAIQGAIKRRTSEMSKRITPREGLQLALARADFNMANIYADMVLAVDADDSDANFGKGMYFMTEKKFESAEHYLSRCLIRKPNEPSIYNNLAMIQLELGRLDEARTNAVKALKLLPGSDAVKATGREVLRAIRKRAEDAAKAQAPESAAEPPRRQNARR